MSASYAVEERESRVPGLGNHAVGSLFRLDPVCERHQAVGARWTMHCVDRNSAPVGIKLEAKPFKPPAFPVHAPDQLPHEA